MPLAPQSIVDPGEIQSRAPLKKSTVGWAVGGVVLLALVGVFGPKLFKSNEPVEAVKADKPIGVGQARQIDGEFDEAARKARQEAAAATTTPSGPLPTTTVTAPVAPVVPPEARRDGNTSVLYGKQMDAVTPAPGTGGTGGVAVEVDAAARNSASVKHDFSDAAPAAGPAGASPDSIGSRVRTALSEAVPTSAPPDTSASDATARIAALVEAQRRSEASTSSSPDRAWLKEFAAGPQRSQSLKPYQVANPYTLLQGKALPAVLGRTINSDLPGEVTAYTTEDVYDSLSSRHLLIPRGSMLSGRYSSAIRTGQERLLFAFTRIILPDGVSVDLPGNPGADLSGASGIEGDVNNHFFKQFANSFLVAFLASKAESGKQAPSVVGSGSSGGAVTAAGQVLVDVSKGILDRNRTIPPTITVEKGTRIIVEVTRDMEFAGPYRSRK